MIFLDRVDAGFRLANKLLRQPEIAQAESSSFLILSIPKGGVIIVNIVARFPGCPHDIRTVTDNGGGPVAWLSLSNISHLHDV